MLLLFITASLLFIGNGLGQDLDCSTLEINTNLEEPISGADLKYCATDKQQCCTNEFLMMRRNWVIKMVKEDIKDQIENQVGNLDHITNGVENALKNDFIPQFAENYCGLVQESHCKSVIQIPLSRLVANLIITNEDREGQDHDFSIDGVVSDFVNATVHLLFNFFVKPKLGNANPPAGTLECIRNSVSVKDSELNYLQKNLTQIRRAVTALMRLRTYVKDKAVPKFLAVPPTNTCIDAFINTRCRACYENITQTCRGACNALTFGCIVPYAVGLRSQFDALWNSTSRIVNITNKLLYNTGRLPHRLYNVNITDSVALTTLLNEKCNLGLPAMRRKRNHDDDGDEHEGDGNNHDDDGDDHDDDDDDYKLPSEVDKNSTHLINSGAFGNNKAPKTCLKYVDTDCWNGTDEVAMNNVQLNVNNIDQLITNSPFASQYDSEELETASESFEPLITNYMKSTSFQTVAPEGLFDTDDGDGGDGDGSGSATILAHVSILLMCLVAYFVF